MSRQGSDSAATRAPQARPKVTGARRHTGWPHPATFRRAFAAMWSPVLLALVAALVADLRTRTLQAACGTSVLAAALALHAATWRADTELPTNVLEIAWAEEWREELPPGAIVVYLGRAGRSVLALPLYGAHTRVKVEPMDRRVPVSRSRALPPPGALYREGAPGGAARWESTDQRPER